MRALFSFVGGNGHLLPLIPIARGLDAAGHRVAFACKAWMADAVESHGFRTFVAASPPAAPPRERQPLQPLDPGREDRDLREKFAGSAARAKVLALADVCASWPPDVIISDEVDFGAAIAGELCDVPYARVGVIAAGSFLRPEVVADPLDELRVEHGLPPDPSLSALDRHLLLWPFPPSFRTTPLPPTGHAIRPLLGETPPGRTLPWVADLAGRPLVYFTLGTAFNAESGDLFVRVLRGLQDLPISVVVTTGRDIDPAELGPQPPNVRVERYVPQDLLLPFCSAVVSHGGSGSVAGALAHGLPSVIIPMGADQPLNADRCAELGVGIALDPIAASSASVAEALTEVLENPSYRANARALRAEIDALPGVDHAVTLVERLTAERQPMITRPSNQPGG